MLRELTTKNREPLIKTRLDRAQGTADEVGDFLEREAVILLEDDGRALLLGQHRHRALDRTRQILSRDEILDALRRLARRRQIHQVDVFGRLHDRSATLAAHPVAAEIQRDAIQPRRELGLTAKAT